MKLGVLLPTFEVGARHALEVAAEAAEAGVDGVFAYDHLWPMGSPQRPALAPFPVLALVASRHEGLVVGPLVARVGLVGTEHLVNQYRTLHALAPGRVIAALGTGDKLSADENEAYGIAPAPPERRRELLAETAAALKATMPVWFGGGATKTNDLARALGVAINLWNAPPETVREAARSGAVSWAGPVPSDLAATLGALEAAGASWAIFSPHVQIGALRKWRQSR
jgi:alkanesulfonate monooxygenase SsuD/methylene tetrahydromethanopterin reductase-like flavin-dependent oxidoreductase (luciferase family)